MNHIALVGTVLNNPVFSHICYNKKFYHFFLKISRESGTLDTLRCVCEQEYATRLCHGDRVGVYGQIHTRNVHESGKSLLIVYVLCKKIAQTDAPDTNIVEMSGYICKEPRYRITQFSNRKVCDLIIACDREYEKNDYIPTIAWGKCAKYAKGFEVGTKITLSGRMQSREYIKKLEDGTEVSKTAYEVSALRIERDEC